MAAVKASTFLILSSNTKALRPYFTNADCLSFNVSRGQLSDVSFC
jgi:hypothetical protein